MYRLMTEVITPDKKESDQDAIEKLRRKLRSDKEELEITDLGAGTSGGAKKTRSIQQLARNSAKPARYGRLLYRLCRHFQPAEILELGTSLGLSSLYLHQGSPAARLITIEGCPAIAAKAKQNFQLLKAENILLVPGAFEEKLPEVLKGMQAANFVFFDGNHRKEPTLAYFRRCLEKAGEQAVFIFDDIHWSEEMSSAWEEIKAHEQVTVTADLFFMGLVFFRKGQEKQHFTLRY
jgi:predicted O-methyltransferase YrrM